MVRRIYETYKDSSPADTAKILRGITAKRGSEKLFGDESESAQNGFAFTGRRRDISPAPHHRLVAATYDLSAIDHMSDLLVPELGLRFDSPVVGHTEFKWNSPHVESDVEGQIYVSEERVIANAAFQLSPEDWGKNGTAGAAEFIAGLGLSNHWARNLNLAYAGCPLETTAVFSGEQIDMLNNSLVRHGELTK